MTKPQPRVADFESYVRAGLQLIPLHTFDAKDDKGRKRGKTPRDGKWQMKDYDNEEMLALARRGINLGVRLPADIMVLDVDPRNFPEGKDSLFELQMEIGLDLNACPHTITGSGGHHYWFRKPADITLLDSLGDFPGVEFKSKGRQVVAAGSVHPDAPHRHYEWDDFAPPLNEMPDVPDVLLRLARRPTKSQGEALGLGEMSAERLEQTLEKLDPTEFREHNDWLNLMMACHHATAGEGRQEFIDWSTSDPNYISHAWQIGRRWDSLHTTSGHGSRPVTIKYLFKVCAEKGVDVASVPPEEDFEAWEDIEEGDGVDDDKVRSAPKAEGVNAIMEELNQRHCVVMESGAFRVFTEERDPVLKRTFFQRSTRADFEAFYSNRRIEIGEAVHPISRVWLNHGLRRQYKGVIFDPAGDHEDWLNLWKGWSVQPKKGDWSLLQQLILETLVGGVKDHFDYVMDWIAYMVQKPARPAEVALVFKGEKGTGKGTLGRAVASLAGAHGLHISSPEHLIGRFNSHLQNCICLFADEAFWAGDKAGESKLKQLVTEPTLTYEGKGRDAVMGKNLIHIIMASNADWVVPAGLDKERRFASFDVLSNRVGDRKFFQALNDQLYKQGGLEAMLYDMQMRKLGEWAPRENVPVTTSLVEQKLTTMGPFERWWYNRLHEGFIPNMREEAWTVSATVVAEFLRKDYHDFARDVLGARKDYNCDPTEFGRQLFKLMPDDMDKAAMKKQLTVKDDTEFGLKNVDRHGRAQCYIFPALDVLRAAFEERLGAKVKWDSEG
jgi:hypothetical protein